MNVLALIERMITLRRCDQEGPWDSRLLARTPTRAIHRQLNVVPRMAGERAGDIDAISEVRPIGKGCAVYSDLTVSHSLTIGDYESDSVVFHLNA